MTRPLRSNAARAARSGFTLIELAVVMAILVVVAGFALLHADHLGAEGRGAATRASLANLREMIVGAPGRPGFLQDLGELPAQLADLFRMPAALPSGAPVAPYDPVRHRGWDGPYAAAVTGAYEVRPELGFLPDYGAAGDPAILDAWHNPIVLQRPFSLPFEKARGYTRLVSAGPDGVVQTSPLELRPAGARLGDDVVSYLFPGGSVGVETP